jgi:hypothetical protein
VLLSNSSYWGARRTVSSFTAYNTKLLDLTGRKKELGKGEIEMNGIVVTASPTASTRCDGKNTYRKWSRE